MEDRRSNRGDGRERRLYDGEKREDRRERREDRRKGPDLLVKIRRGAGVVVWIIVLVILYIMDSAKPENTTFFDRLWNVQRRVTWNRDYNFILLMTLLLGLGISASGLYINSKRNRRKTDKYPLSLLIMLVISILGIILQIIYY